jgi:hypothetical protein
MEAGLGWERGEHLDLRVRKEQEAGENCIQKEIHNKEALFFA